MYACAILLLLFNIFIYVSSGSQLSGSKSVDVFLSWNAQVVVFISLIPTGMHKTEISPHGTMIAEM